MKKYNLRVIQNLAGEDDGHVFTGTKVEIIAFIKEDYENWGDLEDVVAEYAADKDVEISSFPFEYNEASVFEYLLNNDGEMVDELIEKFLAMENLWKEDCAA